MKKAIDVLVELTKKYPPPEGERHSITLASEGHGLFDITIARDKYTFSQGFLESDLDCNLQDLVNAIVTQADKFQYHRDEIAKCRVLDA